MKLSTAALDTVTEATLTRDSEKRHRNSLETLFNEIQDAIFILDSNREIRFLNHAARKIFPSEQNYAGRSFLDVCLDHRIVDTLSLAEELGAKASDKVILRMQGSEKERIREITLLVEAEPLTFQESENDSGSWLLMRDITSELETEQIRKDFIANASHELRTPLSVISGYLETIDDDDIDLSQAAFRRAISTMRKHSDRVTRIVDDMLTISKLENSSSLLKLEPFNLKDSAEEMISQLMPLIEANGAKVETNSEPDETWLLEGDRYYWDQIFFNLIENALKQNRKNGLKISVDFSNSGGRHIISITDNGIGIPATDLPLVFKRFYRVQKHHAKTQVKGTGLGLSIVKRAVEAHGGEISVLSEPGVLTAFTISVPQSSIKLAANSKQSDSY